jgi:thiol-disulfide isomerase/thioredoxin
VEKDVLRWFRVLAAAVPLVAACGDQDAPTPSFVELAQLEERAQGPRDKPLLLVFWATWCEPCVEEIPDLVALHATSSSQLEILSVSLDTFLNSREKSLSLVQEQLQRTPMPYENVLFVGRQDPLFNGFDMPGGIPYAILYDRNGRALERFPGRVKLDVVHSALEGRAVQSGS